MQRATRRGLERPWLAERLVAGWGAVLIARRGELRDASVLPALVAERDGEPVGLLTYEVVGDELEVMSIESWDEGSGVGTALLTAAVDAAGAAGCSPGLADHDERQPAGAAVLPAPRDAPGQRSTRGWSRRRGR